MLTFEQMKSFYPLYMSLSTADKQIVSAIAAEFPYNIEIVANAYVASGYSEKDTRSRLEIMTVARGY